MKNKKFIWILLPGVLLIWGLIFFQIQKAVSGSSDPVLFSSTREMDLVSNDDTSGVYQLSLDYEDPFLRSMATSSKPKISTTKSKPGPKKKPKVVRTVKKKPVKWPAIAYKGLINNKKGNRAIYLLEVDGASVFMSKGEERDNLKLLQAFPDSVHLSYKGDPKRTIVKL